MGWWNWHRQGPPQLGPRLLLAKACEQSTPANIFPLEWAGEAIQGRFAELSEDKVELYVVTSKGKHPPVPLSMNCVCFTHDRRAYAFLGPILNYVAGADPPRITLALPTTVACAERRVSFRVPVPLDSGLTVSVVTPDGRTWPARVVDVSLSGIFLDFQGSGDPQLPLGCLVGIQLSFDGDGVALSGEVRRRNHAGYGVFFSEVLQGGTLRPPETLRAIVRTLEQRWLESVANIEHRWGERRQQS